MQIKIFILFILMLMVFPLVYSSQTNPDKLISTPAIIQYEPIYITIFNANDMGGDLYIRYPNGDNDIFRTKSSVNSGEEITFTNTTQVGSYKFHYEDKQGDNWSTYTYAEEITQALIKDTIQIIPSGVSNVQKGRIAIHEWLLSYPFDTIEITNFNCEIYDDRNNLISGASISEDIVQKRIIHTFNSSQFNATWNYYSKCNFDFTVSNINGTISNISQYVYVMDENKITNFLNNMLSFIQGFYNDTMILLGFINQTTTKTLNISNNTYNYVIEFHNETMARFDAVEERQINMTKILLEPRLISVTY